MKTKMDRRSFIKAAVATSAVAAVGAALAGCSSQESSEESFASTIEWARETEVLVIGFGGGGSVAAVTAAEEGAQVLILEKDPTGEGGGSSRLSGGNFMYTKQGCVEAGVSHLMKIMGNTTSEEAIRAYMEEGEKQLDWMDDHDMAYCLIPVDSTATFVDVEGSEAFQCATICYEDNPINDEGGHVFYEWACKTVADLGIEVVFDAAATRLIQDPVTKEILGVTAVISGEEQNVRAKKAVVLATGGFSANEEMVANYLIPAPMKTVASRYATGDAIKMLHRVGADFWHMNTYNMHKYGFFNPEDEMVRSDITIASDGGAFIFIDQAGKRWVDESTFASGNAGHYSNYAFMTSPDFTQSAVNYGHTPFYCIFDESKRLLNPIYHNTAHGADRPAWTNLDPWSEDNSEEVSKGWIFKADTIPGLVDAINADCSSYGFQIDPAVVENTVTQYNAACAEGVDSEFGRPAHVTFSGAGYGDGADPSFKDRDLNGDSNNLVPIECGPFYAIRLAPVLYTTNGAAKKNGKSQVLDVDGNVIPRLYTAGVDGSITGLVYSIGGQNWGDVLNWGRISGRNAAAEKIAE